MRLNFYLGGILISSIPMEYEGLNGCDEKQEYQEKLAAELFHKHRGKIRFSKLKPEFFVEGVQSKMNHKNFKDEEYIQ